MIGLRGTLEEAKAVAKLFRVYFMKTNDSKTDYLVDHSIIMVRLQLPSASCCAWLHAVSASRTVHLCISHCASRTAPHTHTRSHPHTRRAVPRKSERGDVACSTF
jgi:DNA primase large subunit